jgi:predicted GIY-YIG superfamily endonuclease
MNSKIATATEAQRRQRPKGTTEPLGGTWIVYLLRCGDGSLYTGITNNVSRRCEQHNAGTASRYTRSRLPVALVYQEAQASRSLALKREAAIKATSRQEKESLIRKAGCGQPTDRSACSPGRQ